MSTISDDTLSLHLAPLDACLTKGHRLLSWRHAYEALHELQATSTSAPQHLLAFFFDNRSIQQLAQRFDPFPKRDAQTKSEFESRTAAINVTPAENTAYNIQEIKQDVIWLAEQANVDEVSALRIAILEWQSRSVTRMLTGFAEEERISLQSAIGSEGNLPLQEPKTSFLSQVSRRLRIAQLYLEERLYILRCAVVVSAKTWLEYPFQPADRTYPRPHDKLSQVFPWITDLDDQTSKIKLPDELVETIVREIHRRIAAAETGPQWKLGDERRESQLFSLWQSQQLEEVQSLMHLILVAIHSIPQALPSKPVLAWFEWCTQVNYLMSATAPSGQESTFNSLKLLVSIISLSIIRLPFALDAMLEELDTTVPRFYFQDARCLELIATSLHEAGMAQGKIVAPALFAIGVVLSEMRTQLELFRDDGNDDGSVSPVQRRQSMSASSTQQTLERVVGRIWIPEGDDQDPIAFVAKVAVIDCELLSVVSHLSSAITSELDATADFMPALHVRVALLELLRFATVSLQYDEELIHATIKVLGGSLGAGQDADFKETKIKTFVVDIFLYDDEILVPRVLLQAGRRFPYEHGPFLVLLECLNQVQPQISLGERRTSLAETLRETATMTHELPANFAGYENYREDELINHIILTQDLPMYGSRNGGDRFARKLIGDNRHNATNPEVDFTIIPAGTVGIMMSTTRPFVVAWQFQFSIWTYIGSALSTIPFGSTKADLLTPQPGPAPYVAEMINLLVTQITTRHSKHSDSEFRETAETTLGEASNALPKSQDILTLVFDIFEDELSTFSGQKAEYSTDTLVSCVRFYSAALPLLPSRVWPLLGRSQLLDLEGRGGKLMTVASSMEIATGRYDFLVATAYLFRDLVDDVLESCIAASNQSQAAVSRRGMENMPFDSGSRPPVKFTGNLLLALARTYHDVFLSCGEWRFSDPRQQLELSTIILSTFEVIIRAVHGYDDSQEPSKKATRALAPAATFLIDSFLSKSASHLAVNSILDRYYTGLLSLQSSTFDSSASLMKMLAATSALVDTLFQVSSLLRLPATYIQLQFFRGLPLLVRVYASSRPQRGPVIKALGSLLVKSATSGEEPPSLYGHLGSDVSKAFLTQLGQQDHPFDSPELSAGIWKFLSAVVANRQQWFATFMLTGSDPREQAKKKDIEQKDPYHTSLLDIALDDLSKMDLATDERALSVLRFVRLAQNHWPWVTSAIRKQNTFFSKMIEQLATMSSREHGKSAEASLRATKQYSSVGMIAEILAMYLHNMRQLGDVSVVSKIVPKLGFLEQEGILEPSYNHQLHRRLDENFEKLFPGCKTRAFKRRFGQQELGHDYFYDTAFAEKLLSSHRSWRSQSPSPSSSSSSSKSGRGYAEEFDRANVNLSLVESQIQAIMGWRALAVELSKSINQDPSVARPLSFLVRECLSLCNQADLTSNLFESLVGTCADLALTVLQRLVSAQHNSPVMKGLLHESWTLVQRITSSSDFASDGERLHRLSLRVLLLCIQPWTWAAPGDDNSTTKYLAEQAPIFLSIVSDVVAKGFITLSTELHEDASLVQPGDFAILTAILQTILCVRGVETLQSLIANRLQDAGVSRYATALFSWSDRLTAKDNDPVYAELAIQFLVEASNLQPMTEFMAVDGVLAQLNNAPLMEYYRRKGGVGQFDDPARMYAVWSRGLLPLCLNLLLTVGESLLMEVVVFLNNFSEQLALASDALDDKPRPTAHHPSAGCISLNIASEAHSLALIHTLVERMRFSPSATVVGEVPDINWHMPTVKEDVEAWVSGSREGLAQRVLPTTEREIAWSRQTVDRPDSNKLVEMVHKELAGALDVLNAS